MAIDNNPRPAYMYKDGTWYTVAGKIATGANYIWGGTHKFNSSVTVDGAVKAKTDFNIFQTGAERALQITSPREGLITYIIQDDFGAPVGRFEYWDGAAWQPVIPNDIVFIDDTQTLTNKTLDNPQIIGGIEQSEYIQFDITNAQATATGKLMWDSDNNMLVIGVGDGTISIDIGEDLYQNVINEEALTTISKGKVVYQTGSATDSDLLSVRRAIANSYTTCKNILGITAENIGSGASGLIIRRGYIDGIDTSAFPQGAALYVSSANIGGLTSVRPLAPNVAVQVGFCIESAVNGSIYVDIREGSELDELIGVRVTNKQTSNIIQWNGSYWLNTSAPTGLTIDGTTNTLQNIPQTSVTGLGASLSGKLDKNLLDGGNSNEILVKSSNADFDFRWAPVTAYALPVGGTTGQALVKNSALDFDVEWADVAVSPQDANLVIGISMFA
jgi:hypothetical protein